MHAVQRRHFAILAAIRRTQARLKKSETFESRFTFFRFSSTLVLLAVLAGTGRGEPVFFKVCLGFVFFIFFMTASRVHDIFKGRVTFWHSLEKSLLASQHRIERVDHQQFLMPWHSGIGSHLPPRHLYAVDLDVHTHLFDFLDSCATREGSQALFDELVSAGLSPKWTQKNQAHVRQLACLPAVMRRLDIFKYGRDAAEVIKENQHPDSSDESVSGKKKIGMIVFALFAIVLWAVLLIPAWSVFLTTGNPETLSNKLMSYLVVPVICAALFRPVFAQLQKIQSRTKLMRALFKTMARLSTQKQFSDISGVSERADKRLKFVDSAIDWVNIRSNPILWLLLHAVLPFDPLICLLSLWAQSQVQNRFEVWWQDAVQFDKSCAFARLAWENPDFIFAEPQPQNQIKVCDLGHPLLPYHSRVTNSLTLDQTQATILLTGSNMSGKSTFLRTLGVNMLLFNLGAPVCASQFASSLHRILCAIRVDDSLSDNTSYFYAEVKRLKAILDEINRANEYPALFLIDEIFRGTNNRERYTGSLHVITALAQSSALGLVSTHDLALTDLAKTQSRLCNMHFREHVKGDELLFDYKLREGACPTTNALHIMRSEGLPIPPDVNNSL